VHSTIKKVTEALTHTQSFNVAISELMKLSNFMGEKQNLALSGSQVFSEALESLITMLAPLAPHNASEMYETLSTAGFVKDSSIQDIHDSNWPVYDDQILDKAKVQVVIQVRGKTRETLLIPADVQYDEVKLRELALQSPNVQKHINGKEIKKVILVPSKKQGMHTLLNFVVV